MFRLQLIDCTDVRYQPCIMMYIKSELVMLVTVTRLIGLIVQFLYNYSKNRVLKRYSY